MVLHRCFALFGANASILGRTAQVRRSFPIVLCVFALKMGRRAYGISHPQCVALNGVFLVSLWLSQSWILPFVHNCGEWFNVPANISL